MSRRPRFANPSKRTLIALIALALVGVTLAGQDSKRAKPWTAEDVIFQEYAEQFRISHDKQWVVWMKDAVDREQLEPVSYLVLTSLADKREVPLTRGSDRVDQPCWSPDDKHIAFLSTRAMPRAKAGVAGRQIWLIRPNGGEAWPLTQLAQEPQQIAWLDNDTLIFSAESEPSLYQQAASERKDDSIVVDDEAHKTPVRLYKVHVSDGRVTQLTSNTDQVTVWSASPDGRYVVAAHRRSLTAQYDQKVRSEIKLHDLSSGEEKTILTGMRLGYSSNFAWTPDGSGFYTTVYESSHPTLIIAGIKVLYYYDRASGKVTPVNLGWENGLNWAGVPVSVTSDGFVALLGAGTNFVPARYTLQKGGAGPSWKQEPITGERANNIIDLSTSEDGKVIAYLTSSASSMPQPMHARLDGAKLTSSEPLARLNDELTRERVFPKFEIVHWKGALGDDVEGVLTYPANYVAGKKYPLITLIHGGPMNADQDWWAVNAGYPVPLLNQRDAFVLRPNYHGSANRGLAWLESLCCGHYLDYEALDVNMGVDYLVARGLVDSDRIATMGWSNGAIVSISLITGYPERYKAAAIGAGDVEYISDWGNTDFGHAFDTYYFGKTPMEDPELYLRKSPFFQLDRVRTPLVVFHGTADRNVPTNQSWSLFRALQHYEKSPVKLVLLPGEPHVPEKITHQLRVVREELAWLDKYLFGSKEEKSESLKPGSPLDDALGSRECKSNSPYGQKWPGKAKGKNADVVIPSTVATGGLMVGCFEVTRAQYAAFDATFHFPLSTANYPANGVSFKNAEAYAKWLSDMTGQSWRLPNEGEIEGLDDREGQNTLDYWAGYAPNGEDSKKLKEEAMQLGSGGLLKEVGSFRGQLKDSNVRLFDLGGNVAEWTVDGNGKGVARGGSADCPSDARIACEPAPEYMGFRVVRVPEKKTN